MDTIAKLIDKIEKYFNNTSIRVDRNQTNNEVIRFVDRETKVRINLRWDDIFCLVFNLDIDFERLFDMLEKEISTSKFFYRISEEGLYSYANSPKFVFWGSETCYSTNRIVQGFHKNSEKFAEFIIELNNERLNELNLSFDEIHSDLLYNFTIGNTKVQISPPSDIFKLIFLQNAHFGDFDISWKDTLTIKLYNVNKLERESILQQALFIINIYNFGFLTFGMDKRYNDQPDFLNYNFIGSTSKEFPKAKYYEPICFFNAGQHAPAETRFFSFYKVFEFFFSSAKQSLILENKNIKENDGISPSVIRHEQILTYLLNLPNIKERVSEIADSDFFLDIIERKKKSGYNYNENIVDEFAKEMYRYRNKVVHSMESSRKLPKLLDEAYAYDLKAVDWWNKAISELSLYIIKCLCYDNLDIENM